MRRHPATTAPAEQEEPEVVPVGRAGPAPAVLTRVATCALWALVVVGAIGGSSALLRPPVRAAATAPPPPATAGPSGFAELYVAAYLRAGQGTEAQLRAYYPERVELRDVAAGSRYPARTVTVAVEAVGERYWSVVVAAEVLVADGDEFRRDALRYYRVAVVQPGPGQPMAAASLPAEVPGPPAPPALRLDVGSLERPRADDPVAYALGRFFSAFLAGQGELARYVTPGADLVAVTPAPFVGVEVVRMATRELAGGVRMVLAEVRGTDAAGRQQLLHYSLRLGQREQRWEVAELLPGPPLTAIHPAGVATASTTTAPPGPAPTDPTTATTTEGMSG